MADVKTNEKCNGQVVEEKTAALDCNENASKENSEGLSSLKQRIVQQLEFYFGDFNIQRDTFLKEEISNNDGWVPVTLFEKFRRMSKLTTDPKLIVNAVKESNSELLEISDDDKSVRRKTDLPNHNKDEWIESSRPRTVFVSGFPKGKSHNMDAILDFFDNTCKYEAVIPRCTAGEQKSFKGSVLVIFPTIEKAKSFVEDDSIMFDDVKLFKEFQTDHYIKKKTKIQELKQEKLEKKNKEMSTYSPLPKGALIKITEIPSGCLRGDFVNYLLMIGLENYSFIEYTDNKTEAYIRLKNENSAQEILNKMTASCDGQLKYNDHPLEAVVLEGEEEESKLKSMLEDKYRHNKMSMQERRKKKVKKCT